MNTYKHLMAGLITIALAATSAVAMAESMHHDHDMMSHEPVSMHHEAQAASHKGVGVLKAVNQKLGKVQISHEAITSLKWPAMTMWFKLETALPQGVKVGDKVNFELVPNGKKWQIGKLEHRD